MTIAVGQSTKTFTVAASSFQHFAAGTTVEGGTLTATVQDGTDYDLGTTSAVDVAIVIGMTVRLDMASYSVGEADGTLSFEVIARTGAGAPQPSGATGSINVFTEDGSASNGIDFAFTDAAENFQPGEFSADGGAWQAKSTYSVSITNDALDEDDETFDLAIERNLAFLSYSLVDASGNSCGTKCTVTVTITDNDTAGVTVSKSAVTVTEEDTTGDTYTVVLDSQPTANVTITIGGQSGTDVTATPSPMTFTPTNWATARTVTVTAGNDADTVNDTVSLTHSATSTDTDYSGITIDGVTVTVNDNDTTNTAPTFPLSTAMRSVAENTAAGQNVGAVLTATDDDGDTLTYTLEGADAASFDLVTPGGSARIRTKAGVAYNHEAKSTYTVVVKADDTNGGTATVTVTITITDVDGEAPAQPAAPSVSATAGSTTSLDVTWTTPATTGPPIDDYDLRYREGSSGGWTNGPQNVTGTSDAIGSLDAGTAYQVQVRATNDEGDSNWSPAGSGQTNMAGNTAPVFPATTPMRSVAENTAAGQNVGAVLTATDDDNDPLTYTLEGADASSFDIVTTSGSGQIRTKAGVTYDHETKSTYSVTVKVDDGNGGTDTIAVTITVTDVNEPPGRPAAPTVTATPNTTDSLSVSWRAPSSAGRPAIDSYDLQQREGTTGNWTNGPQNVTGTSATITGLTAAPTAYQVQVRATNDEGDGDWSPPGRIRTTPPPPPVGPPSIPRDLTATAADQAVELSWRRPADDGGARIVRYEYRQQEGDGPVGAWQIIWEDRPTTDHRVTGLMNAVSYTFHVRAVNNGGWASQPSEPARATPEPELEPFEVAIVGVPDVAVAGASYELTAQSDEASLVYAWRVAWGGTIEPDDAQMVVWTAPETAVVAWIRVDATRGEDGATAGQSAYVRVEVPDPDAEPEPEPVPALPLLGQLLLALGLTAAGARVMHRRPRVPPVA